MLIPAGLSNFTDVSIIKGVPQLRERQLKGPERSSGGYYFFQLSVALSNITHISAKK